MKESFSHLLDRGMALHPQHGQRARDGSANPVGRQNHPIHFMSRRAHISCAGRRAQTEGKEGHYIALDPMESVGGYQEFGNPETAEERLDLNHRPLGL